MRNLPNGQLQAMLEASAALRGRFSGRVSEP